MIDIQTIITLGFLLLETIGIVIVFIKMWNLKADKSYVDDKISTYEIYNSRAHAEMKTEITMCETRSVKSHDDIRDDYLRAVDSLKDLIQATNQRLDTVLSLIKNGK